MTNTKVLNYLKEVLKNRPLNWTQMTTHRLDIYNEKLAKTEFTNALESLFEAQDATSKSLEALPTAYDYIRLGHPLSCLLEWAVSKLHGLPHENLISFSSQTMAVLAVLRLNLFSNKNTKILYQNKLPDFFNPLEIQKHYGYKFEVENIDDLNGFKKTDSATSTLLLAETETLYEFNLSQDIDFFVNANLCQGSLILTNKTSSSSSISEVQHVRRRESIAMTPDDCLFVLNEMVGNPQKKTALSREKSEKSATQSIQSLSGVQGPVLFGSCGLSVQYAITMGLLHEAQLNHPNKKAKIIVPPNCYGGTNDQARRAAACLDHVDVLDLPVDGNHDMVESLNSILDRVAKEDAVPYIVAEIPTNPRVEVPDLNELKKVLEKKRNTKSGDQAVEPVFILDQTFCPNLQFLSSETVFTNVKTIAYVSGSKFPSGGLCTAGYCLANQKAEPLIKKIQFHLKLCGNEATDLQLQILAEQLPSMNQRISVAYKNTQDLVQFILTTLPTAKVNFVSKDLAQKGFTPSVFSLDLPSKGKTAEEKESHKRELNHRLIKMMLQNIPLEAKYCVSYGQLKGSYWTIPATSTQGTTKEGDKDYIVRVSLSPEVDLELHKKVFKDFVESL